MEQYIFELTKISVSCPEACVYQPAVKPIVSYTRTKINRSIVQGYSLGHSHSAIQDISIHDRIHKNSTLVTILS
jgi:hypothetical protein